MRLQLLFLAFVFAVFLSRMDSALALGADPNRPVHDKWALIIGVSNFHDSSLNLKYPAKDAQDFADYLTKEGNFAKDHVKLLIDGKATRENILDSIGDKWLPRVAGPDDLVLIYVSSHGSPDAMDVGGVNYVIAHDTDKNRLYSTGIAMQDLARIVKRVRCDRVLILLDACHSGAASVAGEKGMVRTGNISAEDVAQGTGQLVICSSGTNEVSWESKRYQNSVFTHCLIEALRKHGRDTNLATAYSELKEGVETEVRRDRGAQQVPILKGQWQGDQLMVALPPSHPGPGLEDEEPIVDTTAVATTSGTATAPANTTPQPAATGTQTTIASLPPNTVFQANADTKTVSNPTQPAMIAVLNFSGPGEVKCGDGGLFGAIRSKGFKQPRESDFGQFPENLRQRLTDKLKEKFGDRIKGPKELTGSNAYTQAVEAEYLLEGAITAMEFDSDLFGNKYEIEFSMDFLSGVTKKRICGMAEHKVSGVLKSDQDPLTQIYTTVTDRIATIIIDKALTKIGK